MKKLLVVAAFLAVALAGCATANKGATPRAGTQAAAAGTYYCWKGKLSAEGDVLACNWQDSATEACKSTNSSTLARASIATGPKDINRCTNGQWLVQVTTK